MLCPNCNTNSGHIKLVGDSIRCHACGEFSETGGTSIDKILTRNSTRVSLQQHEYEQDMITPYVIDKSTNQVIVNQDFVDLYPEQSAQTFTQEELKSSGNETLKVTVEQDDKGVEFKGDEKKAIGDIIES